MSRPAESSFNVRTFGAVGDGATLDTRALNDAIRRCHESGGGTVLVPAGTYLIGTVDLLSNVTLYLDAGAVLKGSPDVAEYRVLPHTSEFRNTTLLLAEEAVNVAVTGFGTIDGNGRAFGIFDQADLYRDFAPECTRQGEAYCRVNDLPDDGPVRHKPRPGILALFLRCRNVHVSNIRIVDAPNWCLHVACSEDVLITGIECRSSLLIPNSDCIDVSLCRNVRISDCNLEAGDDGIAFSPCADGFGTGVAENVVVENCVISSRSAGIRIGWGEHAFRNFLFNNIIIRNSNRGIGIFARRGETIENIRFTNISIETRLYKGKWWGKAEPIHVSSAADLTEKPTPGCVRDITFSHVTIQSEQGIVIANADGSTMAGITFDDLRMILRPGPLQESFGGNFDLRPAHDPAQKVFAHDIPALYAKGVTGLVVRNFDLTWQPPLPAYCRNAIEIEQFADLTLDAVRAGPAPAAANDPVVVLRDGRGAVVRNCVAKAGTRRFLEAGTVADLTASPITSL